MEDRILRLLMLLFMLLLVLAPDTGVAQLAPPVEQKVNAKFRNLVSVGGFPSIAVGIVRGDQLIYASAFGVTDRKTKQPAKEECARVHELTRDLGLLIGKGGLYGNTLRIKPPLCITKADADFMIEALDAALTAV